LEEFVRVSWASKKAQAKWEPIFSDLSHKFSWIEKETVKLHIRRVALLHTTDIINAAKDAVDDGLVAVPVERVNVLGHYRSASSPFDPSLPSEYKVAVGRLANIRDFVNAYEFQNWDTVGSLLGYPECCRAFFQRYWVDERWFDTTLPMVTAYGFNQEIEQFINLDPRNNILLRWLGLRTVSHLPCSFTCKQTRGIATLYGDAAHNLKLDKEWAKILEILSWPVEWSSLHGIAQIITPVCKITTASDALPTKRVIRLVSKNIPEEAGGGLGFPFIIDTWTANGFSSESAMAKAHLRIIDSLEFLRHDTVVDLGCGNGELLRQIKARFGTATLGIDSNQSKTPDIVMDLYDFDPAQFANSQLVVLVAEQRRQENPEKFEKLIKRLEKDNIHIVIYNHATQAITTLNA